MAPLKTLAAGLRRLFRKAEAERDRTDEVTHFLELATDERIKAGQSPEAARRAALLEIGGTEQVKERVRTGGWEAAVQSLRQDVAYGLRGLWRSPSFTLVALLTLALGIGANTAMFSVVNGILLRPWPYRDASSLALLWTDDVKRGIHGSLTGIPTIEEWRGATDVIADLAIYRGNSATATVGGADPERVRTVFAEPGLFEVLGIQPMHGRLFAADENVPGANVALVTHAFAARYFGADPANAIDKSVVVDGDMTAWKHDPRTLRIVGVLPRGFYFPAKDVGIFEPIRAYWRYGEEARDRDFYSAWSAVGRLRPGVTPVKASMTLNRLGTQLAALYPQSPSKDFPGFAVNVVPVIDELTGVNLQAALWLLLAVVGFVLLIACVNVANLLLARGWAREREFALRLALGAGRGRLLRQLLVENGLLAVAGGLLGLAFAALMLPVLVAIAPGDIPRLDELTIDTPVLAFTFVLTLAAGLIFGFLPAWRAASAAPNQGIKGVYTGVRRVLRLSGTLVVAECALAVVLVVGAGLLIRSFMGIEAIDPGFRSEGLLVLRIAPPQQPPPGLRGVEVFRHKQVKQEALLMRVARIPGVTAVGQAGELMMSDSASETITFAGESYNAVSGRDVQLSSIGVSPGFFEAIGARLLAGRLPTLDDARMAPTLLYTSETVNYSGRADAVVVNEAFVRRFLDGRDPIGVRFYEGHPGKPFWYEIVGVVADVRRQGLETEPAPQYFGSGIGGGGDLVIRTTGDPLDLVASVRAAVHEVEPQTVIVSVSTGDEQLGSFTASRRFQTLLLSLFAALALVLAAIGLFGVMRCSVEQRIREVGVRMALGASRGSIARLVIAQGLGLTGLGVVAGTLGALSLTGLLSHWLFGVTKTDPLTFGATVALLLLVSVIACWLPARRAAAVNPITALKAD